jgi:hypothetical protein
MLCLQDVALVCGGLSVELAYECLGMSKQIKALELMFTAQSCKSS